MAMQHRQDAVDGTECLHEVGYVDIIKMALFKVTSYTFIKSIYYIY